MIRVRDRGLRLTLLAGVSVLALTVGAQNVRASDLAGRGSAKTAQAAAYDPSWTWWVEGGAFDTAGKAVATGSQSVPIAPLPTIPGFGGFRPNWGWEGAIGFDWKAPAFDPWHVSGQFRYGKATKSKPYAANFAGTTASVPFLAFFAGAASANQELHEDHWLLDFAVGRDFGLGASKAQWKVGVRVADLRAKLTANGGFAGNATACIIGVGCFPAAPFAGNFSGEQNSKFLGVGPRLAAEGEAPLAGNWSLDWQGGIAVLFGKRSLDQTFSAATTDVVGSIASTQSSSSRAAVFNPDGQLGLSYSFNPNFKLTASYRVDAYFNALRTLDSAGNVVNVDRIYHGPMLRLTSRF